ncbi:hypothetical protein Droror1_Dr00008393 [Drosera rotundifolia]
MSLEDIVKYLANTTQQFQQETRSSIKNLENQVSQMASTINHLESQGSSKLPSQPLINPKENVSAITLRSRKEVETQPKKVLVEMELEREVEAEADAEVIEKSSTKADLETKVCRKPVLRNKIPDLADVPFPGIFC